jgi:L-alanine-DL-glutamate epimerase-like enolase superfamily enzyme
MTQARLYAVTLHYGEGLVLHTASSGAVPALEELVLVVEEDGIVAVGGVRINIAYLNGIAAEAVSAEAVALLDRLVADSLPAPGDVADRFGTLSAPLRMLVDSMLHDLAARRAGIGVATLLGAAGPGPYSLATNQTLFLGPAHDMIRRADAYVRRGFTRLKLRIGDDFDDDLARLRLLRDRFGDTVEIAVDVNGRWSVDAASRRLDALEPFALAYVEQPVAPDWRAVSTVAERSPLPIMLDESVGSQADVDEVVRAGGRLWAHLKLVKMGGIGPTVSAARRLSDAGVPVMIGQMNEGTIPTAAAGHVAAALRPAFAELYGADGLVDDPAAGLAYAGGRLLLADAPGLGVSFDPGRARLIRECIR